MPLGMSVPAMLTSLTAWRGDNATNDECQVQFRMCWGGFQLTGAVHAQDFTNKVVQEWELLNLIIRRNVVVESETSYLISKTLLVGKSSGQFMNRPND